MLDEVFGLRISMSVENFHSIEKSENRSIKLNM